MVLPHVFKIIDSGSERNRYFYSNPESVGTGDLDQYAILEATALVVGDESSNSIIDVLTDHGDDQRRFVDHASVGSPAAGRLDDRVAFGEILTGGDEGEGSALVDGQLGRFQTDGDRVGGAEGHGWFQWWWVGVLLPCI